MNQTCPVQVSAVWGMGRLACSAGGGHRNAVVYTGAERWWGLRPVRSRGSRQVGVCRRGAGVTGTRQVAFHHDGGAAGSRFPAWRVVYTRALQPGQSVQQWQSARGPLCARDVCLRASLTWLGLVRLRGPRPRRWVRWPGEGPEEQVQEGDVLVAQSGGRVRRRRSRGRGERESRAAEKPGRASASQLCGLGAAPALGV